MIRTRELLLGLVLAKGLGLAAAFWLVGADGDERVLIAVYHVIGLALFIALLSASSRQSPRRLIAQLRPSTLRAGRSLTWALASVPLGLLARMGAEGVVLGWQRLLDSQAYHASVASLETIGPVSLAMLPLTAALMAVGAAEEEFTYRRVLSAHAQRLWGLMPAMGSVSLLFGLIHLNPVAGMGALFLSVLYFASGRLWVPIVAHLCANLVHEVLPHLDPVFSAGQYAIASIMLAPAFLVVVLVGPFWLRLRMRREAVHAEAGRVQVTLIDGTAVSTREEGAEVARPN